uniref:Uncharacterized protein n=1 Tax=Arundo donax TaxID=35708 RepID=A0A0A9B476_ARUDO
MSQPPEQVLIRCFLSPSCVVLVLVLSR